MGYGVCYKKQETMMQIDCKKLKSYTYLIVRNPSPILGYGLCKDKI